MMCGHCHALLSKTLYYTHKQLYFNPELQQWTQQKNNESLSAQVPDLPGSSDSDSNDGK